MIFKVLSKPFYGLNPWGLVLEISKEKKIKGLAIQPVVRGNQASEECRNNHA